MQKIRVKKHKIRQWKYRFNRIEIVINNARLALLVYNIILNREIYIKTFCRQNIVKNILNFCKNFDCHAQLLYLQTSSPRFCEVAKASFALLKKVAKFIETIQKTYKNRK